MPILPAPEIQENRGLRSLGLDAYPASTGEVLGATYDETITRNPWPTLRRAYDRQPDIDMVGVGAEFGAEALGQERPRPTLQKDEANEKWGIRGELAFDRDTPETVAREMHELKRAELQRRSVLSRAQGGFAEGAAQFGVGLGASILDPLNIASAFIPVVGQARYAIWAQRFGTTGARATRGAIEGAVGAAVVEPIVLAGARYEQADYDATDSMLNLAFGTVLGGGLHVGLGKVGDLIGRLPMKEREAGFRAAVAEFAETGQVRNVEGFVAYHGSPHEFTAFDMSKVGTGEGAASFGHGLYFAESEGVARSYQRALAPHGKLRTKDGTVIDTNAIKDPTEQMAGYALMRDSDPANAKFIASNWKLPDGVTREAVNAAIERLAAQQAAPAANLYKVRIKADKEKMLDWDKPLGQQPKAVQAALRRFDLEYDAKGMNEFDDALLAALEDKGPAKLPKQPPNPMGEDIYKKLSAKLGGDAAASKALKEAGIPGIRYLDQKSRSAGDGTRNFVLFDDKLVEMADAPRASKPGNPPPPKDPSPHNPDDLTLSRAFDEATASEPKPQADRLAESVEEVTADLQRLKAAGIDIESDPALKAASELEAQAREMGKAVDAAAFCLRRKT